MKLLKMCTLIEKQDSTLLQQLVDYLHPKVFSLSNDDLAQLYAPLVLMNTIGMRDNKLLKAVESLTLRRLYQLEHAQIAKITKAYSLLQGQSVSLIKTISAIVVTKADEFSASDLCMCISALSRLNQVTNTEDTVAQLVETLEFAISQEN